jgi:two-component system sensor histidine kinase KdpD
MNEPVGGESFLAQGEVTQEEARRQRGKLRVFLGYAAGVGKTYAMLDAARQDQANGVDVVVASLETHGQAETDLLGSGLEDIPCQIVENNGLFHTEMDLDAVLVRHPQLALVDELAHQNSPGRRHCKRYQDVEELLEAGISVYTTLNIQHLESLNDVVAQITGVVVDETVPDYVLESAHDIELVDLPVAEVLRRLDEGRMHIPTQATAATRKFFRPGNLNALRELALRQAAERVDRQMQSYMQTQAIAGPWPANDRIMVCVSPSPLSERLVRAGRRLAARLDAEWYALYVATPGHASLTVQESERVLQTLRLAEELGAKAISMSATTVVEGIVKYASSHNVNKIVAGKPLRPRWQELWHGSLVEQIIRRAKDIDVYVISSSERSAAEGAAGNISRRVLPYAFTKGYLWSIAVVVITTLVGLPFRPYIDPTNLVMLYLMGIVITALQWGRGPSMLASLLSVVAFDIVFVPPYDTIVVHDAQYLLTFAGLFIVGVVVSTLTARMMAHAAAAHEREEQATVAFELSYDLATALTIHQIMERAIRHTQRVFAVPAAIYMPTEGELSIHHASDGYRIQDDDLPVVEWAYRHRQPAGVGTGTLASAAIRCLPLMSAEGVTGVLALQLPTQLLPPQRRLLESFANQIALALERAQLADATNELRLVQARETFQSALLGSISHDLRTPLVAITGALSALQEQPVILQADARQALVATAREQAARLDQLVGNLLDMSRLEGGSVVVKRELCDLQDLVGAALERTAPALVHHHVELDVPDSLPSVPVDFVLMVQVLANLLDNAAKYSQAQTTITIRAIQRERNVELIVADEGIGIAAGELEQIFVKFHRAGRSDRVAGTGLGLSISKGLVEAHGGRIWAENRAGGGSIFTVELPLSATEPALR